MHHGTTKIGFFYEAALKKKNKFESVNENEFRYPGPKPQTKETGIVMLADAVEASTRSIENPTVQKIEERIDDLIKARFMEGQLDECELTLRDLTRIKASFLKILSGIHHSRMQYPEQQTEVSDVAGVTPPADKDGNAPPPPTKQLRKAFPSFALIGKIVERMKSDVEKFFRFLRLEKSLATNSIEAYQHDIARYVAFLESRGITSAEQTKSDDVSAFIKELRDLGFSRTKRCA